MPDFVPVCLQDFMHSSKPGLRSGKITSIHNADTRSGAVSPFMDLAAPYFLSTVNEHDSPISENI